MDLSPFGKTLVVIGLIVAGLGVLLMAGGKIPWLGRLPGDIFVRGKYGSLYFPLASCLIVSILVSLIIFFFRNR
ncbi:MAG TPA: DUF2905 domain-containing protein [Deltaproteobacteria bacterium]|nr:DUF2905 domain-containing protein [Deltaproteobacteria bacterium]